MPPYPSKTCIIYGCGRPFKANNFCNRHNVQHYTKIKGKKPKNANVATLGVEVAHILEVNQEEGTRLVKAVLKAITNSIQAKNPVKVRGFGVFDIHNRHIFHFGPRIYFKPSKELRYMVNDPSYRRLNVR